jgi:hypothetical protein
MTVVLAAAGLASACREAGEEGEVVVHYLGHASFLLAFPHGPTVLTDYGESNAYGLDRSS